MMSGANGRRFVRIQYLRVLMARGANGRSRQSVMRCCVSVDAEPEVLDVVRSRALDGSDGIYEGAFRTRALVGDSRDLRAREGGTCGERGPRELGGNRDRSTSDVRRARGGAW